MGDAGYQQQQLSSPAQSFHMFTPNMYNPASGYAAPASNEGSSNGSNNGLNSKTSNGNLVANGVSQPHNSAGDQSSQYGQPDGNTGPSAAGASDQQPTKFSRSKGACQQCRAVKQRCSGASKHPCERCQLYKLDCVFSKDGAAQPQQPRQPKKTTAKAPAADPETSQAVLQSLRVITERLRGIEEQLTATRIGSAQPAHVSHAAVGFDHDVKIPVNDSTPGDLRDPMSAVASAIKGLDNMMGNPASPFSTTGSDSPSPRANGSIAANYEPDVPDAVSRGFVTVEEAQQLFDFFFTRCVQWTPPLDPHIDRNMYHVRRRSTFLFHAILSVSSYFCYVPQGENGLRKYYAIVTTLVESLAPLVVSPSPAELSVDLLTGLLICITWKPVRCGSEMQLGPAGFATLQAHSKLNPSSGYVLGGLALRISQLLGLARKAANPDARDRNSTNACRLWLWINLIDSRAALAEGKAPALDPADVLRITRLFASLKVRPGDVRLAATVELYAAIIPIVAMQNGTQRTDFRALYRANAVIDRLCDYWRPLIEDARQHGDPIACSFLNVFVPFARVVLNADVFRTWYIRRKLETRGQEWDLNTTRFTLTSEESHCLGFAVSASEEILYFLSSQSKDSNRGQRVCEWAPRDPQTGHRPPLQLDPEASRVHSSAPDFSLLIVYAFPPLFLAQLRAQNLINCDLDMAPEITNDLYSVGFPSRALLPASKFMRLLELSSEFYELVSPNKDFPAIPQAQLLRTMACLSIPQTLPPGLQGYKNGELFAGTVSNDGVSCMLPGALNTAQNNEFDNSAQAKAHEFYMQQIANNVQPTNSSLPYPYNNMVFSTEGADRLDAIMQAAVPDPLTSSSLLNSFAKIDADWNAYFNPPPTDIYSGFSVPTQSLLPSKLNQPNSDLNGTRNSASPNGFYVSPPSNLNATRM